MSNMRCIWGFSMENLERMFEAGLYINDLSMHDCSRDLVLAGTQQSAELKMALDQVCHWDNLSTRLFITLDMNMHIVTMVIGTAEKPETRGKHA